jgi:hypothetical protein
VLGYGSAQELLYVGEGSKCKPLSRILTLVPQPIGQEEGPKSLEGFALKTFSYTQKVDFLKFSSLYMSIIFWAHPLPKVSNLIGT